jgi:peptidyl-tRNA hydrolase
MRLRFGVGRPEKKEEVAQYVLSNFDTHSGELENMINQSVKMIEEIL